MNRVAYNSQTSIPDNAYDDVFDASSPSTDAAARLRADSRLGRNVRNVGGSDDENDNPRERLDPSPTGYRDYTPPAELLRNTQTGYYSHHHQHHQQQQHQQTNGPPASLGSGNDDKAQVVGSAYSSAITDSQRKDEAFTHKTILLGDSGVGKTSLLVQFDTGQFQSGNFAATVGIGFTASMNAAEEKEEPTSGCGDGDGGDVQPPPRSPAPGIVGNDWSFGGSVAAAVTAGLRGPRARSFKMSTKRRVAELLASHQRHSFHETPTASSSASSHQRKTPSAEPCEHAFKVMLLGDSGVGKTCLLTRFRDGRFLCGNFITTVGIDFRNKIVTVDNTRVKLQIWDTAGQERFRSITHAYYRDAHALLLLYDVTNKTSYDNIRAWLCEIREYAHDDVVIMLLGNKCDCGNERVVRKGDGERLAREHNVPFMETSAKTGLNVELAFFAVARHLKARKSEDPDKTKFNVQDYVRQQSQASNCFTSNCSTT